MPGPARHFAASSSGGKLPKDSKKSEDEAKSSKPRDKEKAESSDRKVPGFADDDVDPLDAFMAGMQGELKEDMSLAGSGLKRKYDDFTTGLESSKGSSNDFDQHAANWGNTKGAVSFEARKAWIKKMNRMRGEPTFDEPPPS
mmetsp:Transcript_72306/g.172366  ORF Transcript_72306/g.172366 Transcript_72306/m.172366 type:complete len:142 (-) Transcript_72306:13-438(-)